VKDAQGVRHLDVTGGAFRERSGNQARDDAFAFGPAGGVVSTSNLESIAQTNVTYSAWMRLDDWAVHARMPVNFGGGGGSNHGFVVYRSESGIPALYAQIAMEQTGGTTVWLIGPLPAGEWTHAAITWDGAWLRFYMNGELKSSNNYPGASMAWQNYDVVVGQNWTGAVDEVRVYNRALSAEEVNGLFTMSDPPASGLVHYWDMNAPEGAAITVRPAPTHLPAKPMPIFTSRESLNSFARPLVGLRSATNRWVKSPLFGTGFEATAQIAAPRYHNDWLTLLASAGLIGLAAMALVCWRLFRIDPVLVIPFVFAGTVNVFIYAPQHFAILMLIAGLASTTLARGGNRNAAAQAAAASRPGSESST